MIMYVKTIDELTAPITRNEVLTDFCMFLSKCFARTTKRITMGQPIATVALNCMILPTLMYLPTFCLVLCKCKSHLTL